MSAIDAQSVGNCCDPLYISIIIRIEAAAKLGV